MEGMNLLSGAAFPPEFILHSDSYFTERFNSLHLIKKQISSCIDLQCPAIDIQHFLISFTSKREPGSNN